MHPVKFFCSIALAVCGLFCTPNAANAGLLGKTLQVAYYGSSTIISVTSQTTLVTNGVEWAAWPATLPGGVSGFGLFQVKIDITDTTISIINMDEFSDTWRSSATYIKFTDITNTIDAFSPTLTSITQTISGLSNSQLAVTDNVIALNVGGLILPGNQNGAIVLSVGFNSSTPTPVPEPSSLLLLGLGLCATTFRAIHNKRTTTRRPPIDQAA